MITATTAALLRRHLDAVVGSVAFVPTMGALHAGHMALVEAARRKHDVVVASVFVNPTQFNEAGDLAVYPRTPDADADLLAAHGCDLLYLPEVEDVYPQGKEQSLTAELDFGSLTAGMEGANRPGHFDGVAQVVSRLLEIVRPAALVMGQKDYQQVAIVRSMIRQLGLEVELEVVPTVREADGLAMSSRNRLLSAEDRTAAGRINQHLDLIVRGIRSGWDARLLEAAAFEAMANDPALDPEYVEIFDGDTLLPWNRGNEAREVAVAAAVRCGKVRLIDNRIVGPYGVSARDAFAL